MSKILVTGCAGFIGYHLCISLLQTKKYNIYGIDNLNSYYDIRLKKKRLNNLLKNKKFFFHKIDLVDKKKIKNNIFFRFIKFNI